MLHSIFLTFRYLVFWYNISSFGSNYVFDFVSYFTFLFSKNNLKKIKRKKERNPKMCSSPVTALFTHGAQRRSLPAFWPGCTCRGFSSKDLSPEATLGTLTGCFCWLWQELRYCQVREMEIISFLSQPDRLMRRDHSLTSLSTASQCYSWSVTP